MQLSASFFTTLGYLASTRVDTDAICQRTSSSVSCNFHGYDLRPGSVVVVIELASWGTPMSNPVEFYDHPEDGTRVTVGGTAAVFSEEHIASDHVRLTWKTARPDAFGNWVQIDADIRGPGEQQLRQQVETMVASFRFSPPPSSLPRGQAAAVAVAASAVAELRARSPAAYACFP
jgi:hypothetical protein